ncbi:hypothetical protein [Streptomyces sp. NRRL F-5126]|uniref:hypothetical protein n=1 Tax=Streptomyces sp. NRRL F-5126 TaxID=1463857 RepID=UPI000A8A1DF2|nr:hypothetical protein [Streptomyces sp. NRRL F-5126]
MAGGGFSRLPNGRVVVALTVPRPAAEGGSTVRVLVHAENRARALTRLRNLGLRAVYLRGNAEPPSPDEVTAVLHHPEGLLWRPTPQCPGDASALWQPIRSLVRPGRAWQPAPARPGLARKPMAPWRHLPATPRVRTSG